jgi:hypothetical protein
MLKLLSAAWYTFTMRSVALLRLLAELPVRCNDDAILPAAASSEGTDWKADLQNF